MICSPLQLTDFYYLISLPYGEHIIIASLVVHKPATISGSQDMRLVRINYNSGEGW